MENNVTFRQQLAQLLQKSNAHAGFDDAIEELKPENRGVQIPKLPYTIWQIVEHIRIAQEDILEFSVNQNYQPLNWPADYWPAETAPKSEQNWDDSIAKIKKSLAEFTALVDNEELDLLTPFPHGEGQNLFREAVLIIDHLSYHVGQIVLMRRLLDDWEN